MDTMAELGRTMEGHADTVLSVCVSADGSRLFSGSADKTIKVWDMATGACVQTLQGHTRLVYSVCVSADGSRLFSGSKDKTIKVWNIPVVAQLSSSSSSISSVSAAVLSSEVPDELRCPIGFELFIDPVIAGDGFNYERAQIVRWFQNHTTSPKMGKGDSEKVNALVGMGFPEDRVRQALLAHNGDQQQALEALLSG